MDCIFCKIVGGEIPSSKVYDDEYVCAFKDLNPQMPVHVLVVPKIHIASAADIDGSNSVYVAKIFEAIPKIVAASGLVNGFRVITNCGPDACQSVKHLHFHLLGGGQMSENMK